MKPYIPEPEMLWKPNKDVEEARADPRWEKFHKECGKIGLFFDRITRQGCVAFMVEDRRSYELAHVEGARSVWDAVEQGYRQSGRRSDAVDAIFEIDEFEELL